MSITFQKVLQTTTWDQIEQSLIKLYEIGEENMKGYHKVYHELLELEPATIDEPYVILIERCDEDNWDVSAYLPSEDTTYSFSFTPWEEWLSSLVSDATIHEMNPSDCVAHCLWEMTFYGYSNESIQEQAEELSETVKEIKNNNYTIEKKPCVFCNGTKIVNFDNNRECSLCDEDGNMSIMVMNKPELN